MAWRLNTPVVTTACRKAIEDDLQRAIDSLDSQLAEIVTLYEARPEGMVN